MKQKITLLSLLTITLAALSGCGKNEEAMHSVNKVFDHVYEIDTYKELDEEYADSYYEETYDKWEDASKKGGGCSAIKTVLDDGTVAVGRNMDLNISNKCAYIIRTDVPNKYSTFGLAYSFRDISPNESEIIKNNNKIDDKFYKLLPFMCDDVMNDKGLYIELNMRTGEYWPTGEDKFACQHTNEYANKRVYMFELPRYIAENCRDLNEAKEYLKTLDVYSKEHYWNYAFLICDKKGNSSILEFAQNSYHWNDDKICQTNFYLNKEWYDIEKIYSGLGRYDTLMEGISEVHTKEDLLNLMKKVNYYQVYTPYECKFDPRSEDIGALPYLTYELIFDEEHKEQVLSAMDEFGKTVRALSREQQMNLNQFWESTFTEVVDVTNEKIYVRFFENDETAVLIDADGTYAENNR